MMAGLDGGPTHTHHVFGHQVSCKAHLAVDTDPIASARATTLAVIPLGLSQPHCAAQECSRRPNYQEPAAAQGWHPGDGGEGWENRGGVVAARAVRAYERYAG